jgi:hypothetical protein
MHEQDIWVGKDGTTGLLGWNIRSYLEFESMSRIAHVLPAQEEMKQTLSDVRRMPSRLASFPSDRLD